MYDVHPCKQLAEQVRLNGLFSIGVPEDVMVICSGPSEINFNDSVIVTDRQISLYQLMVYFMIDYRNNVVSMVESYGVIFLPSLVR